MESIKGQVLENPTAPGGTDYVKGLAPVNAVAEAEHFAEQQLSDEEKGHPPYLRKRGTSEIFAWNPHLAERDDMGPWPWPTISRPTAKSEEVEDKGERIADIMRAMSTLAPSDFSSTGVPKMVSLRAKLGYTISITERDEAYDLYRKGAK